MERSVLKQVGYDINIPISYRFLRRYAKCVKSSMEILTLGRFILELSLQSYNFVAKSASKMAAAALWLALKMKKSNQKWVSLLFIILCVYIDCISLKRERRNHLVDLWVT